MGRLIYFHYELEKQKQILRRRRAAEERERDPWGDGPHGGGGPYGGGEHAPAPEQDGDEEAMAA